MSATIYAPSFPERNLKERTRLTAVAAAGATSVTVESAQGMAVGKPTYLGDLGAENCELIVISAITGKVLTVSALQNDHAVNEDVNRVEGNQIKFYRAANVDGSVPADGSFVVQQTTDIEPDQKDTLFEDANGSSSYWYKWSYKDSVALTETPLDEMDGLRGSEDRHYATLEQIRRTAGLMTATNISNDTVAEHRRNAENIINGYVSRRYTIPFTHPVPGIINDITKLLAAGKLMNDEYGQGSIQEGPGDSKIREAMEMLQSIQKGTMSVIGGDDVSQQASTAIHGWPDDSTEDADLEDGGARRKVRIGMEF